MIKQPLTVEVFGLKDGVAAILDRVICGSVHLDEAKGIGQRLFSIVDFSSVDAGTHPKVIASSATIRLIYDWQSDQEEEGGEGQARR